VPGAGFVPLGFGVGFTCPADQLAPPGLCPDVDATDPTIRSRNTCWDFEGTTVCPDNIPNPLPDGSVVLQSAEPHGGLQGYPQVIVALANAHRVYSDALDYRGAGLLVHRGPTLTTDDAFANAAYPNFPELPASVPARSYPLTADPTFDLHWLVINDDPRDPTAVRWHIFTASAGPRVFNAPLPPAGLPDPFANSGAPLIVRHTGLRLNLGETLTGLAESGGLAPARLFDNVAGFATRRAELPRDGVRP